MKPAFCSIAVRDEPLDSIVPRLASIGYEGIEIWGPHLEEFVGRRSLPELAQLLEAHQLPAACLSPYFDFVTSDEKAHESRQAAARAVEAATALGRPLVRLFTGPAASAQATPEQWERAITSLREVCDAGAPHGITFVVEVHPDNLMDTTASTLLLLNRVGRANLRVNLDIFNLFARGEDVIWALNELYPHTAHIHLKNRREGKPALLDEGELEYSPFMTALRDRWYGGYLSVEWFGPDPYWAAAESLSYLRSF